MMSPFLQMVERLHLAPSRKDGYGDAFSETDGADPVPGSILVVHPPTSETDDIRTTTREVCVYSVGITDYHFIRDIFECDSQLLRHSNPRRYMG
jgi:hypothetical protein